MFDGYNRKIDYLRISVTDRCNLRCAYCMPKEGVKLLRHEDILSFEKIVEISKTAVSMGIEKIRITGGEPLVRKGIVTLVSLLAGIDGIMDLAMTTNGTLLKGYARQLAAAGLRRINISLDVMEPQRYHNITKGGNIRDVLEGIEAARAAGLWPIKLNCVVEESSQEKDAVDVGNFAKANGFAVRYIRRMDIAAGLFWPVEGGTGGVCKICNRLRLSSDGLVKPCLFSNLTFSVSEYGAEKAIRMAIEAKPESGNRSEINKFHMIGG